LNRLKAVVLHVTVIAAVYCICPVATSGDSLWTVPVALSLIRHGSTAIVAAPGERDVETAPNGRTYSRYPVWVGVIAAPFVAGIQVAAWAVNGVLHPHPASPTLQRLLAGDLAGAYTLVEMLTASMLMAIAAGLQLLIALEFLPFGLASLLTCLFALATPVWATASRAMWNHTPALLMLSVAIYLLILARREARYAAYVSIPLAMAFMMRPTMAISALVLTAYVAVHYRPQLARFAVCATVFAAIFFGYNLSARGQLFQSYFVDPGGWPAATWLDRFGLQLVSPSRGLFIFCPLALFSVLGIWLSWRKRWLFPLAPWLACILGAQVLLVSKYFWPGVCYGPRYFTDVIPILTLFLIPVLQTRASRAWRGVFVLAAAWSIFVEARGAIDFRVHEWNGEPTQIDRDQARVWDWKDPQFLRGLH
jgi:hypothetical protein